tara:strand:+ start:4026 stop:4979 length:954 start_codon:yes stop_codon:yes gene_type:complete
MAYASKKIVFFLLLTKTSLSLTLGSPLQDKYTSFKRCVKKFVRSRNNQQIQNVDLFSSWSHLEQYGVSKALSAPEVAQVQTLGAACIATYGKDYRLSKQLKMFKESEHRGLKWKAFHDKKTKNLILAFRGTQTLRDLHYDGILFLLRGRNNRFLYRNSNILGNIIKEIDSVVDQMKELSPKSKIYVTGHSLGGLFAQLASIRHNLNGVTFSAPGVMDGWVDAYDLDRRTQESVKFKNFIVLGDPVPFLASNFGEHHGEVILLNLPKEGIFNSHSISHITNDLKNQNTVVIKGKLSDEGICKLILFKFSLSFNQVLTN